MSYYKNQITNKNKIYIPISKSSMQMKTRNIEQIYVIMEPIAIDVFKVNHRNTWSSYEICSKLTIKTSDPRQ